MKYISIDKLKKKVRRTHYYLTPKMIDEMIDEMPSADIVDVQHGTWVDADGYYVPFYKEGIPRDSCYCSVCGEWLTASDEYYVYGNFCPNCGTDMRDNIEVLNK